MKSTFRSAVMVLLVLAMAGVVHADYHDLVYCGDLSSTDCDLLTQAHENASGQAAGNYSLAMDVNLQDFGGGSPNAPGDFSMSLDVDTVWSGELAGFEALALESMDVMADPDAMLVMLGDLLSQLNAMSTVTLVTPQGFPGVPQGDYPEALLGGLTLEMRLVDGYAYFDLSSLATIMAADDGVPSGWLGFHIMDLLEAALESSLVDMDYDRPKGEGSESDVAVDAIMAQDMAEMEALLEQWTDPDLVGQFMTIERLDDQILEGRGVAVFRESLDLHALFASDEFMELLMTGSDGAGEEQMAEMAMMMGMVADSIKAESIQYVSLEDRVTLREDATLTWDMAAMMAMTGDAMEGMTSLALDFRIDYNYPDVAPEISVPENAFIISPGLLLAGANA